MELLEVIKKLGLNEYESKAYLALLKMDSATASAVSKVSLIPRARVYDVLTSLEKKGFIERKLSKPVKYNAFSPKIVAKNTEKQKRAFFEKHIQEILNVGETLEKQVSKDDLPFSAFDEVRLVVGQQNIYAKISAELQECNESVIFCSTQDGLQRKKEEFKSQLAFLLKKGVKINFKESDLRYCVIDKKLLFLFLFPDKEKKEKDSALFIRNQFLAKHFFKK